MKTVLCPECQRWVRLKGEGTLVRHQTKRGPKTPHERRMWRMYGKPLCDGSGRKA